MVALNDDPTLALALPSVGRFTMLSQIGQGGMGVIFRAF